MNKFNDLQTCAWFPDLPRKLIKLIENGTAKYGLGKSNKFNQCSIPIPAIFPCPKKVRHFLGNHMHDIRRLIFNDGALNKRE